MASGNNCKAITASGEQCRLKAGPSGYCHIHDPEQIAERKAADAEAEATRQAIWAKGENLREVIRVIEATCRAKGWYTESKFTDRENWRYATVYVSSQDWYLISHNPDAIFDVSLRDQVINISERKSSFSRGIEDLYKFILIELHQLSWLVWPQSKVASKQPETPKPPDTSALLEKMLKRFHDVARQLKHRHANRETLVIKDEYDVQDLLHALLRSVSDDIRQEDPAPSHAGASSRTDFLLKKEKIVIEVKMSSSTLKDKQVGEQLIIDIERYQSHPACQTLVCFVYNPEGWIRNPVALENDLSRKHGDIQVKVLVIPH